MHLPHRAGFPGDCLNPAGLRMRPPRPANGAAQILQRGGDGIRRNTRRWLARPALSPVSTARTCSRVNASPAIYSTYRHKHRQCHLFAHRRPPLTALGNAAGRAVSDRSRVGRFSSRPSNGHRTESEWEWLQASRLVEHRPSADFFTQLGKCPSDRLAGSLELRSWATRMA
jgi:hypothetical protein